MSLAIQRLSRGGLCRSVFVVVARWTRPRAVDSAAVCLLYLCVASHPGPSTPRALPHPRRSG